MREALAMRLDLKESRVAVSELWDSAENTGFMKLMFIYTEG
jgi:hypothetical protein